MKKTLSLLLLSIMLISAMPFGSLAAEPPTINAKAAAISEMTTGDVVFAFNADDRLYPASTTKVMTAIIALENSDPESTVHVLPSAISGLIDSGSSVYLKSGENMAFMDMLTYLLVASGNDAANALAEHVAGSIPAFVSMMNEKAKELGCENTHFANPHGLHDENHYTTARDLLKIAEYAMGNETFRQIVLIDRVTLPATNKRDELTIFNTNHLISRWRKREYYYDGALGIKTGSTTPAGLCLISGVKSGDLTYITVVLGASQADDGSLGSFTETIKLLNYAKVGFAMQPMSKTDDIVTEAHVSLGRDADTVLLSPESVVTALLPVGFKASDIKTECTVNEDIKAPVARGDVLGTVTYFYNDKEYGTVNLVAADAIERSPWLYIADTVIGIFSSTAFKAVVGGIVLLAITLVLIRTVNRRRRRRKGTVKYRGRRR